MKKILPSIVYPLTMFLCIGLYFVLKSNSISLLLSSYIPVIIGATIITLLEIYLPHNKDWTATKKEIKTDFIFMVTVQMILPKILTFTIVIGIFHLLEIFSINTFSIWPNFLPIGIQAILMVLIADFFRYWFHVISHSYVPFWKLHAVHHSPKKLYWLNVGRFHPIEKGLQFLLDALPFIILGLNEEVLALYFVFYAVNGFFQHCNINLNMGILNYVISSAELHRWHHSRIAKESNKNYGNNIILWDLVFGTYYLPKNKLVKELGLVNQDYPTTYTSQFLTPFSGNIDKKQLPLFTFKESSLNFFLKLKMQSIKRKLFIPLVKLTKSPAKTQEKLMLKIIQDNKDTEYGKLHNFSSIIDYESFKKNIPINNYEDLRRLIEQQDETKQAVLTQENPFMFNQTSGTSGKPKYIPVLKSSLTTLKETQQVFAYVQYNYIPEGFNGKILAMVSPAKEGHLETGTAYGSASGHIAKTMPRAAKKKYVLPNEVSEISNYKIKYYIIARLGIEEANVTYIGTANPSTFHKLLEVINSNIQDIIEDIRTGNCKFLNEVEEKISIAIKNRLKPNQKRANYLLNLLSSFDSIEYKEIWPFVKIITTWTGGSCGISLQSILPKFPADVKVIEAGYLASEFRGSLTIEPHNNIGIPTIHSNFFEFVQKDKWEDKKEDFLELTSLEEGEEYYVFITTTTGLYRYNMNDIIRVTGKYNETPTIQFIQKGKGVTNITGEKLYEGQIITSMTNTETKLQLKTRFYMVLANEEESRYYLYYESDSNENLNTNLMSEELEKELMALNLEYKAKRLGDRLKQLKIILLKNGSFEKYKEHQLNKGIREGQFKITLLQYSKDCDFDIQAHEN